MTEDDRESPTDPLPTESRQPWFRRNRSGPGWHPSSWQGGLILGGIVVAIVALVVLLRTGVL
ncbi:MAG TPA: hypothetical protein PJ998_06985 [Terrimesophilobacter sp.]|nr:hypothetical protein [Terrimesophilobacter sp.]